MNLQSLSKLFTITIVSLGIYVGSTQVVYAIDVEKFKHTYSGTWKNTYDRCGSTGETGTLSIALLEINRKGKIKSAYVTFSDSDSMVARGAIKQRGKNFKLHLRYDQLGTGNTYSIVGTITSKKIAHATYNHTSGRDACNWGGSVNSKVVN